MKTDVDVADVLGTEGLAGCDLVRALEADERFRRDTFFGAILHPGRTSFRETSPTDSLHVVIQGTQVSAHVDEISPLVAQPDGSFRYAWGRVVAHNLLVVVGDLTRRLRGQQGVQRCDLRCEIEWFDDDEAAEPEHVHGDAVA
ncbi:MAG TPA: hypothetical protein VHT97_14120 [Acidimicrobiales bacterium]|jgi:hypothetical protein|nr:hypothetical protein [Acidimicrobiales bacterium]